MRWAGLIATFLVLLMVVGGEPGRTQELAAAKQGIDEHALFEAVGHMYSLDPDLLEAIARAESGGRADAVSPKGAVGLMQLMPATAATYRVGDRRDAVESVLGAARFLVHLRETPLSGNPADEGSLANIIAAYNAGEGAVWRYNGVPPYEETRTYVGRVLWFYLQGEESPLPPKHFRRSAKTILLAPKPSAASSEMSALEKMSAIRRAREVASTVQATRVPGARRSSCPGQ